MMKKFTLHLFLVVVLSLTVSQSYAGIVINGKVTNRNDIPVANAELLYGNHVLSQSQADGSFSAEIPDNAQFLTVRSKGYLDNFVKVTEGQNLHVVLDKDVTITTPYFNIAQESFNGSASSLRGDDVVSVPVGRIENTFTGRLNGLITNQVSGNPGGDGASFYVRGRRTNAEGVLFLIDGQPGSPQDLSVFEVESVTVLKDAAALALYGMRAANGAVLVTTKRGEAGKMKINFSAQAGYQAYTRTLDRIDAATFASVYNEAMYNENPLATPRYSAEDIRKYADGSDPERYPNVNWYDDLLNKGTWMQKYNVDISGGNENTRYFVSLGAHLQSGVFDTDDEFSYSTNTQFQRYNFRTNVDFKVTNTTFVGVGITMRFENRNYPGAYSSSADNQAQIMRALRETPPNAFPKYYADNGSYVDNTGNRVVGTNGKIVAGSAESGITNPWAMLNRAGYSTSDRRYGALTVNAIQKLDFVTEGLALNVNLATDIKSDQFVVRYKDYANYELMPDGTLFMRGKDGAMMNLSSGASNIRGTTLDAALTYNNTFGRHETGGSIFYNLVDEANDWRLPLRYQGFGGLFSYSYDNRYFADITFAYQGSNNLPSNKRYAFTPAFSAGWIVSNEDFIRPGSPVSFLKLRGSVGQLANSRGIGYYEYLDALASVGNVMYEGLGSIAGKPGYNETSVGNPNLTWEKSVQWNAGIDAGFFRNKLWLTADYFQDYRRDMYMTPGTYSYLPGAARIPKANVGKMKSSGYEISVSWSDRAGDFGYRIGANYARYKNKVTDFNEPVLEYDHMYAKGYGIDDIFGLVSDGLYQNWNEINNSTQPNFAAVAPGDIRYRSLSGLPEIDATYDRTRIAGGTTPRIFYSADVGFSYKGFELNLLFQGAAKVNKVLSGTMRNTFVGKGSFYDFQLDRWQNEGSGNTPYPRLTTETNPNSDIVSSYWVRNAGYFRLKNADFGYTFTKPFNGVEKIRLFVSGYNLALLRDKIKVMDPESPGDASYFPIPRTFNFGVNVTF